MTDDNKRTDAARAHDDHDIIDSAERGPAHGGASGGNLQRDIAARAEEEHEIGGDSGVTRVRASDKKEEADLPRFNER
jgi:hypothetical protein